MILAIFHMDFQSELRTFGVLYFEYANVFKEIDIFIGEKNIWSVPDAKLFAVPAPTRPKNT